MRSLLLTLAALVLAPFLATTTAHAQIPFTLNSPGITFDASGLGIYTPTSSSLASSSPLLSYNLLTRSSGPVDGYNFAGFTYNSSNTSAYYNIGNRSQFAGFDFSSLFGNAATNTLNTQRPYFIGQVAASSATLPSYETQFLFGNHSGSGNTITTTAAVPEPSSYILALLATALFAALTLRRRAQTL